EALLLSITAPGCEFFERKDFRGTMLTADLDQGVLQKVEVHNREGVPVEGAIALLGDSKHPAAKSDKTGMLSVNVASGKSVPIALLAPDGSRFSGAIVSTPNSKPLKIGLPRRLVQAGRVIDMRTRVPLEHAFVWTISERWNIAVTDKNGRFRLTGADGS